jgi:hypothetical protein
MYIRNEDKMLHACLSARQRHLHDQNQESRSHPQISPVFLVGAVRREEPHRLHAVVHRTRNAGNHPKLHGSSSALFITHAQKTPILNESDAQAVRSKAHPRIHTSSRA